MSFFKIWGDKTDSMLLRRYRKSSLKVILENLHVGWCHFEPRERLGWRWGSGSDAGPGAAASLPAFTATLVLQNKRNVQEEGVSHLIGLPTE